MALRAEWWLNHGDGSCRPYGDDGEMQCCGLDFKTRPIQELQARVEEMRLNRIVKALAAKGDAEGYGVRNWTAPPSC